MTAVGRTRPLKALALVGGLLAAACSVNTPRHGLSAGRAPTEGGAQMPEAGNTAAVASGLEGQSQTSGALGGGEVKGANSSSGSSGQRTSPNGAPTGAAGAGGQSQTPGSRVGPSVGSTV